MLLIWKVFQSKEKWRFPSCLMLPYTALCCLMLPQVALCCLMLPYVFLCCLVLHYVARYCRMLLYGTLWYPILAYVFVCRLKLSIFKATLIVNGTWHCFEKWRSGQLFKTCYFHFWHNFSWSLSLEIIGQVTNYFKKKGLF